MFTKNGCFNLESNYLSFKTEWILFLPIILVLCISFIAYIFWVFLNFTLQTLPNPPLPITYWQSKCYLVTSLLSRTKRSFSYFAFNLERSILKQFLISFVDFFDIVELLRLCSFSLLLIAYLASRVSSFCWGLPDITTPVLLLILIFLHQKWSTWSVGPKAVDFGQAFE